MQESGEMYLETILVLKREKDKLRAIDIVKKMGISKPSVSRALGRLKTEGYVSVDEVDIIELTDKGRRLAEKIYERHEVLSEALRTLGVSEATADADACKIEHDISDESFEAIKSFMKSRTGEPLRLLVRYSFPSKEARDGFYKAVCDNRISQICSEEPGCILYEYELPQDCDNVLLLHEEWEDEASQQAHLGMGAVGFVKGFKLRFKAETELERL